MIKTISHYKSVLPFSKAPNAFLVIAKAHKYKLNTALFKKQRTGYWKIKNGRVNPGDALFLVMEPEPLVRELFGGIVKAVLLQENGTKIIQVDKFIELGSIDGNFSDFFGTRATSPNSLTSAGYLSDWGTGNNRFPLETESEYGQSPIDIDYGESYQLRSIL